jgi:predicted dinucleotide-binding enzyme
MLEYRAYFVGRFGQIMDRVDLVCGDDEAAKERVKQMVDGHAMELWHEGRMVATFEPEK